MKNVLIVDDSTVARMMISRCVSEFLEGCEITTAESGEAALEAVAAAQENFDLAILDFNMPGIDGLELAQQLHFLQPDARLILATANNQKSLADRAHSMGVGFIVKPPTQDKLRDCLGNCESHP
ncbi:MAG: two-component system chemotaxis response regulator CheY [Chlamydiales bacterium]|jgi:two-component system chemotaxis response regulator CheY